MPFSDAPSGLVRFDAGSLTASSCTYAGPLEDAPMGCGLGMHSGIRLIKLDFWRTLGRTA